MQPTTKENLDLRLGLRYLLFYLAALTVGTLPAARGVLLFSPGTVCDSALIAVSLAAPAAFLTVGNSYLALLTVMKGLYDAALMYTATLLVRGGSIGLLHWNASFILVALSLVLFLFVACRASKFFFENSARDLALILSKPFFIYLLQVLAALALAFIVYLLWQRLGLFVPVA